MASDKVCPAPLFGLDKNLTLIEESDVPRLVKIELGNLIT